jgi:hypothetical protein
MVVRLARCQHLPSVSKDMLRLGLLAGGLRLKLWAPGRLGFWGAALSGAKDLRLELQGGSFQFRGATEQIILQLVAAAPGNSLPGVTQLSLGVSCVLTHMRAPRTRRLNPLSACCLCLQWDHISTASLIPFPCLQRLMLQCVSVKEASLHTSPWVPPAQLQQLHVRQSEPSSIQLLLNILQVAPGLEVLKINWYFFNQESAAGLGRALQRMTQLRQLDFTQSDEAATALAPALQQLTGLSCLDLEDSCVGPEGMEALAPSLQHLTGLRKL